MDDLLIMLDCLLVPHIFSRLYPAPFYREPVCVDPELFQKLQVLSVEDVMIGDIRGRIQDGIPGRPVGMRRAFKLEGGRGDSPEEIILRLHNDILFH